MSLQSIRNLNMFATLAAGYIGLTSAIHKDNIYLKELKECSKRIYGVPKFIFYALGCTLKQILTMRHTGISAYMPKKVKPQQITLFDYFKIADPGGFAF